MSHSRSEGQTCSIMRNRDPVMSTHKFRVGQMVDFFPSQRALSASVRAYKILRLMPSDAGELLYRIKTISEPFERVAKESELRLAPVA